MTDIIPPKLCECGCGSPVKPGRRFIYHHHLAGDSATARSLRARASATRHSKYLAGQPVPALCECGCGSLANPGRRFIYGHNRRGVTLPASSRAKMSAAGLGKTGEKHNSFGTKRSPETRAKMRAAKLGKTLTPEHKEKIGAAVRGENHPNWQGGRKQSSDRYVVIWVDPSHPLFSMAGHHPDGSFYIREHRLVMAESLGRPLAPEEVVHHKLPGEGGTGDTKDNRIENLELFPDQAAHMRHHQALIRAGKVA